MNNSLNTDFSRNIFTKKRPFYHFSKDELQGAAALVVCFALPFIVWAYK
jgi:hypothetical protein